MSLVRGLSLAALAALVSGVSACSIPDRAFGPPSEGGATSVSSTGDGPASTSTSDGSGAGDTSAGGGAATSSSSSQGGGVPATCGDGDLDPNEDCDEDSSLCVGCKLVCPQGWFPGDHSCFAVALENVVLIDALTANARCGALDVGSTGHRAHPATPANLRELNDMATRCTDTGCWLGFFALGPPGDLGFTAPDTNEALLEAPPWGDGEPSSGLDDICVKVVASDGIAKLEAQPCTELAFFACELELGYGSTSTCHDGTVDAGEDCDDDDEPTCVECDRQCPDGWLEDPRTHACLLAGTTATWTDAQTACEDAGGRLATPDEVPEVRIAQAVTANAWIGLDAADPTAPVWISNEPFTYLAGTYPLSGGLPDAAAVGWLEDGEIRFDDATAERPALCEAFAPDD